MLKPAVDEITQAVNALIAITPNYRRGDVVPWEQIEAIAGNRKERGPDGKIGRPRHIIQKWRWYLQEQMQIVTLCVHNTGVHFLTDLQAAKKIPYLHYRKSYRATRRDLKKLKAINDGVLSPREKLLLHHQMSNLEKERKKLFTNKVTFLQGIIPTETNPRRPIPTR